MFEQFLALLNGMEDGESKTNLVTAFQKISDIHKDAIESRDGTKVKLSEASALINSIKSATGLDDLSVDSLKGVIKNGQKSSDEVATITKTLEELRTLHQTTTDEFATFKTATNAKDFELALSKSDIFKDVSSDPFLRSAVMGVIKDKLMAGDDGGLYAKGADGSVMKHLVSNDPITGQELFTQMVESGAISKTALNPTVNSGNGTLQTHQFEAGTKTMARTSFEQQSPQAQSQFMRDGGQITD